MTRPFPKVLFISPTVAGYIGGTETVVSQLCLQLKSKVRLTVLSGTSRKKALISADGFELETLAFIGRDTRLNVVLSKLLMSSPFKIESYSFFKALKKSNVELSEYDCILTFYEADAYFLSRQYPTLRERFRHFLPGVSMRRFFRRVPVEHVFFFGYRGAEKVKRKWNLAIPSLPLGVDTKFFPATPPSYPASKRLVYIGRLDGSKHVDWLADFFVNSRLSQKGYRLDIVGDGPLMHNLVEKHGRTKDIIFHGRQSKENVIAILRDAFLLLHPTDLESFGLTILEAMAAGVPVITHGLDSIKIWAENIPTYAEHLDDAAWEKEILKFECAAYWEDKSIAGYKHAKRFTWDKVAEQVFDLLACSN